MKKLLMVIPLALILCFMVGCQDKEAMAELEKFKAQAEVEKQNKEVVLKFYEELDNDEFLKMIYEAFPKWQHKMEEIIAVGDKVITRAIDYTTHEGEFQGIPATGNKVEFGVIVIYSIDKGKIVEMREEGDMLGFFQQLGMELKPKEEGEEK